MKRDYFDMFSHLKVIMSQMKKEKSLENYVLREIFNDEIKDKDEEEINNMKIYSALFENRLHEIGRINQKEKDNLINALYDCYLDKGMIKNYSNGDIEAAKHFYKAFDERIKELSGYYEINDFIDIKSKRKIL